MNKMKIFGVHLQRWHLYFIIPLLCLMIAGCAAGLLLVGTALSGASGAAGGASSGSSVQRRVTGLVFSQGSENVIAPLGGATVWATWSSTRSILGSFTKAVTFTGSTTTNSDGSYELDGIDDNTNVEIVIEKDGHTTQIHNVNTGGSSPSLKGTLSRKNQNKKTVFSATENDVNTDSDVNEKGESIPRCHVAITPGAVTSDTEVDLSPYYSMYNLPRPIPDGYIGLAGADFSAASTVLFTTGKEAKPYVVLPSAVRATELAAANIKLMELIEVSGVTQWVVAKNAGNQDQACKYHTSGAYDGMLGPDDSAIEANQAKLKGIRPFCFVYSTTQLATITGRVRNTAGATIAGAMVFGGGSSDTTDLAGDYILENVIALSASSASLIMVNAIAPNYQLASAVVSVLSSNVKSGIDITLETMEEVAILGGKVTDTATTLPIAGAKVVCTTNPYIAAFAYDNNGTAADFMDDVLSVTPPANLSNYRWNLISPSGARYQSSSQNSNSVMLNTLFSESGFNSEGSYRADLGITMTDERVVTATAGFMSKLIDLGGGLYQQQITDIKLPVSLDPSITMEAYSNTQGNYRLIGVPTGVELKLQASKSGYQSSGIRTIAPLTQGQTKEENFSLNAGSAAVASIWITPSPSVNLQNSQTVQFSGVARDDANNTISPTPSFTWTSSNPVIASINTSGLASALGAGTVTIEASNSGITSNAVTVQVGGKPAAPSNFTAVASSYSTIDLAWQDNSTDEDEFDIERSTNGITYTVISTQYPDTVGYNDTGLSANTQYWYRVYANNANGDSNKASADATTPSIPVPNGPTALIVTATDATTINLEWTDNSDNETGFQIRRSLDGDTYNVIGTVGANTFSYLNSGLTANTNYYYRIYAYNGSGNSTAFASGSTWTPDTIPSAPSGLAASTTSSSAINLTWTDNSNNELGFKIERSPNGVDTWTEVYTTTAGAISYPNSGLTYNTTYYYRIRSYNTAGNSGYTPNVYATTNQVVPADPTLLTLEVLSDISMRLTWTDASNNEDGFKVRISTNGTTYTLRTTLGAGTTVFTDTGLSASTTYWYGVYAYNTAGDSGFSNVYSSTTNASPIPSVPIDLVANPASSTQINLFWTDTSYNENGFKIERAISGTPGWTQIATPITNTTSYQDTPLSATTTYGYRILAYNGTGDSNWSSVVSATTGAPSIPAAPTALTSVASAPTIINLSWTDNADNEDGFTIQQSPEGTTFSLVANVTVNTTSYIFASTPETTYYFRVYAYNAGGNSGYSNIPSATTPPEIPIAPTALTAAAISPTAITITWTDNSNNETGFRIERLISGSYQEIGTAGANAITYTNTGLPDNTLQYYKVRAYNVSGNSDYTNVAEAMTPMAPPAAPTNLITTTVTASAISLEWVDNATNEEGFKLQRSTDGITYTLRATPAPDAGSYNDTGLSENTAYWYRIYAFNAGGNSGYAGPISATTLLPLPSAPSTMTANAVSASQINLSWTDNSNNETGFKVDRSPNGVDSWTALTQTASGVTTLSDIGLSSNTTYYYRVCAYNATGDSGYSNIASATTFEVIPNTPGAVTATAVSPYEVSITWTDNSTNETGFKVERKTGGAGTYDQVATPTANTITYPDSGLSPNTTYYYRVRAYNGAGNSAYCSEMAATTPLPPIPNPPSGLITTTVTSSSIGLQWTDNSTNEDGFKIERKITSGSFTYLDTVSLNVTAYTNTGLTSGITYTYRVYAYNGGGDSGYSTEATATTLIIPPNAPSALTTTSVTSSSIGLQWQDNSNDETKFYIERSPDGLTFSYLSEVGSNVVSFTNSGLPYTTTYWYRVYAYNTAGSSGFTNVISGTTLGPPPPNAPSNLIATAQAIDKIQLTWQDNSGDEDGFKVYRSPNGITYTQIATNTANSTIYSDMPVSPSVLYYYRVMAYNAYGDSAAAGTTGIVSVQPDAMIRLSSDIDDYPYYLTNNLYETTPVSQTKGQGVESKKTVSYYIRVQNDGNLSETFKVTGTGSSGNWTVTYYDVTGGEPGTDITGSMTGISGYVTSSLGVGGYITIRMEVGQMNVQTGSYYDAVVRATSTGDPTRTDTIKARNEAIPSYYSISGSVSYTGTKTGRVYIDVNRQDGGQTNNGTSISANSIPPTGTGAYIIRGVQPGNYRVYGWMDHLGEGTKNDANPYGSSGIFSITNNNVTGMNIFISDPITPSPVSPANVMAFPTDSSVLIFSDKPKDTNGREIADLYRIYWSTSVTVSKSSYLGYKTVPINRDDAFFITGLTNGNSLYFVATAFVGAVESAESPTFGPVVIGPATGSYNVSGTIFYPGVSPTGPLYVGVYNSAGAITCTRIVLPSSDSQTYSFAGVANGTYMLWAIMDMNNNGLIDTGDYKATDQGISITVNNVNLTNQNIDLPLGNGIAVAETEHRRQGADERYNVELSVNDGRKLVVAVAAVSGPGVISPIDISNRDRDFRYGLNRGSNRPITSDNYAMSVTYADATTETLNAPVTAVLDCFAQNLSPNGIGGHVVPTFTWAAPASPPPTYNYYMWVNKQTGGDVWRYPRDADMPSSQLSVLYNTDGQAKQPNLDIGTNYDWFVMVIDSNSNKATEVVSYSPTYFDNQPDAAIGLSSEPITSYLTDNLYESYPISQIKSQNALNFQVVSYLIRLQNEGKNMEPFRITGTAGSYPLWTVSYYDAPTGGIDITPQVTGGGYYTPSILSTDFITIRVEVTAVSASSGTFIDTYITTISQGNPSKKDAIKATTKVPLPWRQVVGGAGHTVAIKDNGTLWSWGDNYNGQLGLGDNNNRNLPTQVGYDTNWQSIAAGYDYTMAVKSDGSLWAWGYNYAGQLGLGGTANYYSPTRVGIDNNWQSVTCGYSHTLAIKIGGTLWTWGDNWSGQLGFGDTTTRYSPSQVGLDTNWSTAAAGNSFTLALKTDGTIWSCGVNADGRLGLGNTTTYYSLTKVSAGWQAIAAGQYHGLALKTDKTLWVWGYNSNYQLGLNDITNRLSPTQVGTDANWVSVAGGDNHSLAAKTDGSLWSWGYNGNGQLGLGDTNQRTTPARVGPDNNWANVTSGFSHSLSLRGSNSIWVWGNNGSYQLGLGNDWNNRLSPVWLGQ
ncbi:MAG: fibronectin type III domain-containing protein [Planctomycetota bacterium]